MICRANRVCSSLCVSDFTVRSLLRFLYIVGVSCWLLLELYMGIEGEKAPKPWKTVLVECHHEMENKAFSPKSSFRLSRKVCQAKAVSSAGQNECFFYLNSCIAKNSRGQREQASNSRTNGESIWLEELKEKSSLSFFFLKSGTIFEAFIDKNTNDCF